MEYLKRTYKDELN